MRWRIGNGIFEMRNDGKMEISVMEGEENVVLGVEVRKRSRNGAGRIGNETVSGGRGGIWKNKKAQQVWGCWGREVSEIKNTRFGVYLISMVEGVKIDSRF